MRGFKRWKFDVWWKATVELENRPFDICLNQRRFVRRIRAVGGYVERGEGKQRFLKRGQAGSRGRCPIYQYLYIINLSPVIIHLPSFINHLKINLSHPLSPPHKKKKFKPFYCTTFAMVPVKDFRLVKMYCWILKIFLDTFLLVVHCPYIILFHRKKTKRKYKKSKWARNHARHVST